MPSFSARDALRIARELRPSAPVIIVTGSLDEETAVEYIKQGAADYILKTHLTRLPAAVASALTRLGIDARRLQARGFGADRPIADNATEEGRALNRRVELTLLPLKS